MPITYPPIKIGEILHSIKSKPTFVSFFTQRSEVRLNLVRSLDQFPERGLIPLICHLLFDDNDLVAKEAARIIEDRIKGICQHELISLDRVIRSRYRSNAWGYNLKDREKLNRFSNSVAIMGIASCFPSGYIREFALKKLSAISNPDTTPYILLRLNDWVPQIRDLAKKKIIFTLKTQSLDLISEHLSWLERISYWKRADNTDIEIALEDAVANPQSKEFLLKSLKHSDFRVRRLLSQITLRTGALSPLELFQIISTDSDPIIRFQFIQSVKSQLSDEELLYFIEILKSDRFMPIRREVLKISQEKTLKNSLNLLEASLIDPHLTIRDLTRWYFTQLGSSRDCLKDKYRKRMSQYTPCIGAISGLGEVGDETDADSLFPFLNHKKVAFRRAAFYAISKLKPALMRDIALHKLQHDSPSIIKEARKFIINNRAFYTTSELWKIFLSCSNLKVQESIIQISEKILSKWEKIIFSLKALEICPEALHPTIENQLKHWMLMFNRSFIKPTETELTQISHLVAKSPLEPILLKQLKRYF